MGIQLTYGDGDWARWEDAADDAVAVDGAGGAATGRLGRRGELRPGRERLCVNLGGMTCDHSW